MLPDIVGGQNTADGMGNISHQVGDYEVSPGSEYDFPRYYEKDYTRLIEIKKR